MSPDNEKDPPYTQDELKATAVMVYTQNHLILGEVITKPAIRVSTWLRTPAVPNYIPIHNAQVVSFQNKLTKPQTFREILLSPAQIIAFHLKPPAQEPLDYDPNEPMRKMEPVSVLLGPFRFDGVLRMSSQSSLERYLDVAKEAFLSLYEVDITQSAFPNLAALHVSFVLVRSEGVLFSPRTSQ